ncbi:winged helix-turn-helix domain-containing protein [Microbacterium sp. NPDC047426]
MVIAHDLRVSVRSVQRWRSAWSQGGPRALASKGPASLPVLSDNLFAVLECELLKGPVAHGWPDQTWTLSRIKTLIGRRFHKSYTAQGVAALLKRHGWSCQVPARRAIERDEADTTVKIDTATRDRLAAIAAARGTSVRALLADLAVQEENQLRLADATAGFREVVAQPGIAEAFDRDFGGLPAGVDSAHRAA